MSGMQSSDPTVNVDSLTDEQVIERYFAQDKSRLVEPLITQARQHILSQFAESDEPPTDEEMQILLTVWEQEARIWLSEIPDLIRPIIREVFSIDDLRVIVRFREEYPDMLRKQELLAIKSQPTLISAFSCLINRMETALIQALDDDFDREMHELGVDDTASLTLGSFKT